MKLHRNAALSWNGRRQLAVRVVEQGSTLAAAAEAFGVSVRCARKWVGRYKAAGEAGLVDRSSAPRRIANRTDPARVAAIAKLRRGWGGSARRRMDRPCHRVAGDRSDRRNAGKKGWEYLHVTVDDYSRLAYAEVLPDEKAKTAVGFLRRALRFYRRYGIRVEAVITDSSGAGSVCDFASEELERGSRVVFGGQRVTGSVFHGPRSQRDEFQQSARGSRRTGTGFDCTQSNRGDGVPYAHHGRSGVPSACVLR
jgi:hypothetical protein